MAATSSTSASLDRRRINGPEKVFRPVFRWSDEEGGSSSAVAAAAANAVAGSSKARDAQRAERGDKGTRPMFIQTNLIPQANGSAYMECQGLKVACAVYGPRQSRHNNTRQYTDRAELNVEVRYAPFAGGSRMKPGKSLESPTLSSLIHASLLPSIRLALLPKASLDIYLSILEADAPLEGVAALCTTAASVALAGAGVQMWGLAVGACAAVVRDERRAVGEGAGAGAGAGERRGERQGQSSDEGAGPAGLRILVDPTRDEGTTAGAGQPSIVSLCTLPALGTISALDHSGGANLTLDEVDAVVQVLTATSAQVHMAAAEALQEAATAAAAVTGAGTS